MLATALLNMLMTAAVLRVAEKHYIADAAAMDSMVQLQQNKNKENKREKAWTRKIDGKGKDEEAQTL